MKIGDRDTPGTRIYAEREFRESCQVLVATEAAGEGINLQFCWLMINYDIPWNPVRLEQRMGRIHRYGQEKDCLIFNFVTTNTREGRVLQKLFERIEQIEERPRSEADGQGLQRARRRLPGQSARKDAARYVRAQPDDRGADQAADRRAGGYRALPEHHEFHAGRTGKARTEPVGHRRQIGGGQRTAAGAGSDRGFLRCRPLRLPASR